MKSFVAVITLLAALSTATYAQEHRGHKHTQEQKHEVRYVAKNSSFKAVCSKGDLNATYSSRAAAVKAAQSHQRSTGHPTSVKKQ